MDRKGRLDFVKLNILDNWRFWNKYQKSGRYEEAGREVVAQANALLEMDESNERAAALIGEALAFRAKKVDAGRKGGLARVAAGTANTQRPMDAKRKREPMPGDKNVVMDYAADNGLSVEDAFECWNVTVNERNGMTADGKKIDNWKAYVRKWCTTRNDNRENGK